jgi:beta-N-acetylhexosaminidase
MTMSSILPEQGKLMLGQLFMVGLPGLTLDDSTLHLIQQYGINNFIYFKRNVESREQLEHLSRKLQKACSDKGLPPPLIAIDQEGGTVARLPPPFTQFPDARLLAEAVEPEKALTDYAAICTHELKSIGVNYNLAPVLDVCERGKELFMERRSLGGEPEKVARLGCLVINEMQERGIAACAKHFPGLGAAVVDPHVDLPYVAKTKKDIMVNDLAPFRQAIATGVASIMTSHTIYRFLDPEKPATLSKKILTDLLRHEMNYEGVVITDDLEMGAIEKEKDVGDAARQAFEAGADLLLICYSHKKVIDSINKLADMIEKNSHLQIRMSKSLKRINFMRRKFSKVTDQG